MEEKRPNEFYPIGEDENGSYILNAKDLCMIDHLDKLAKAGVTSFKIEGRAKSFYYTAVTANAYRWAVDGYVQSGFSSDYVPEDWILEEMNKVSHRPYGTGFYFGTPAQEVNVGGYVRDWEVVAAVEDWQDGKLYLSQRNRFFSGETASVLMSGCEPFDLKLAPLYDEEGQELSVCPHPTMRLWMPCDRPLVKGTLLRCKRT